MWHDDEARADALGRGAGLVLLTCSMARDLDIFGVLARSVDAFAAPDVRHVVIVPRRDLATFQVHAGPRRIILAQEEILPMRLWQLPKSLGKLAFLHEALRRPLYVTARGKVMRGWMIQQILKIEFARRSPCPRVVHVDSDVFFVRPFGAADVQRDGKTLFFRVDQERLDAAHRVWGEAAAYCLGQTLPEAWSSHYIENCVPWDRDTATAMVDRIETVHGRPYHDVLLTCPTISEYFIYGLFADLRHNAPGLAPGDISLCNSFWPAAPDVPFHLEAQLAKMNPWHKALAVQSTHHFQPAARAEAYAAAVAKLANEA